MPTGREHTTAVAFMGSLYVAGGRNGGNLDAFERYSPSLNSWATLPPMPTARSGLAAAALHGRIYVFGGEGDVILEENESYDYATNSWRREADMKTPRHGIGAAAIGGRILIPGGATIPGFGTTEVNEAFAPEGTRRRRAVR